MSVAIDKTLALKRQDIAIELLDPAENNPNEMSDAEFNLLYSNLETVGFVDPIFVRAKPDGRYRVIGGHHRLEVAKLQEFQKVPCTVIDDPEFDEDKERFQIVRMNVIRGRMNPDKFLKMYNSLGEKYSHEVMKDAFGFANEQEFQKLVKQVQQGLPKEVQQAFKDASKNVKTIDDLSKVLNSMFAKYGDTLSYGYMVMDFGGKESVWLRCNHNSLKHVRELGEVCRQTQRSMDALVMGVLQLIAEDKLPQLEQIVANSQPVSIPDDAIELPTEEFLASLLKD